MQKLKIQLYAEKSSGDTTVFDQTHKGNKPQKGTNDVRKTDKSIFQRTGEKPQRKRAGRKHHTGYTCSLVKSLMQHYSKAQSATSKQKSQEPICMVGT